MGAKVHSPRLNARIACVLLVLSTVLAAPAAWAQPGAAEPQLLEAEPESVTYWLRNREGWFWYRDPPLP